MARSDRTATRAIGPSDELRHPAAQDRDEDRHLDPRADRDREADPGQAEGSGQDDRQAGVDENRHDPGDHRGPGVLAGIERSGQNGDQGMGGKADEERQERRGGQVNCRGVEPPVAEEELRDLGSQDHAEPGDREHHEEEQPHGPRQQGGELVHPAEGGFPGEGRKDDDAKGHADHADRDLEQRERNVERADGAVAEGRRNRGDDDERDLGRPEADCSRRHERQCLAGLRVGEVDEAGVAIAEAGHGRQLDEEVADRAGDDTDREARDPERRLEEHGRGDDREVVDDRGDRGRREPVLGVEDARRHGPEREEDRPEEHDPGQVDGELDLCRIEARRDRRHDRRGGEGNEHGQSQQPGHHQVGDRRDDPPGPLPLLARGEPGDDRDERRRECPGRDELEHQVWQAERREERVELRPDPEDHADDRDPDPAEQAGDEVRARDDEPRLREVAVRHPVTGPAGSGGRLADRPRMGAAVGRPEAARRDVGVDLRCREALVAEKLLDDPQVGAAVEEMRREGVAQGVGRDALRQTGPPAELVEPVAQPADAERDAAMIEEDLRGVLTAGFGPGEKHRPAVLEERGEGLPGRLAEQPDSLLAPLAEHPDLAPPQVGRGDRRRRQLADPEPGGVGRLDKRAVPKCEGGQISARAAFGAASAAESSSSTTLSSRSTCSTSRTRGRRRGRRGVAIAPHGSPGASPSRAAWRWNERIAASRCAVELRAPRAPRCAR